MKKFGFGLMRLPVVNGNYSEVDIPKMTEMVDAFLEAGGTYFDTAYPYHGGNSEKAFQETVVKRYPRERFTITDKMPVYLIQKPDQMQGIFEEQLMRCGVEFFDYYWLHALAGTNYENVQKVGAFDFLVKKKEEGRVLTYDQIYRKVWEEEAFGNANNAIACHVHNLREKIGRLLPEGCFVIRCVREVGYCFETDSECIAAT